MLASGLHSSKTASENRAGRPEARTRCDVDEMRRLTEIGFALHESSRAGGALVTMPLPDRESIHVDSRRWGSDP